MNPVTPPEQLYNQAHIRTRNTIERLFGLWKRRFPVLAYGCRLKISTVLTVITATAVLHNIANRMGDVDPPNLPDDVNADVFNDLLLQGQIPVIDNLGNEPPGLGNQLRRQLIDQYFSNL